MSERIFYGLVGLWALGIPVDWAYWIATREDEVERVAATIFGWGLALFWPMHALVELWWWLLT